jgi:hypothetical protein
VEPAFTQRASIMGAVRGLTDVLGPGLVAVIASASTDQVSSWADGSITPSERQVQVLRDTAGLVGELIEADDASVVRSWFMGMNPQSSTTSPPPRSLPMAAFATPSPPRTH